MKNNILELNNGLDINDLITKITKVLLSDDLSNAKLTKIFENCLITNNISVDNININ